MSTLGMCALFYSVTVTSSSIDEDKEATKATTSNSSLLNNKLEKQIKLKRELSSSPRLYSYMANPKEAFQRYVFGYHAKTKRSLAEEAESGDEVSVNSWIKDGYDPNEEDSYGYTPLISASALGRLKAVKYLVQNGADVNKTGPFGFSALHAAAQVFIVKKKILLFLKF